MINKKHKFVGNWRSKDTRFNRQVMLRNNAHWFFKGAALLQAGEHLLAGLQDSWRPVDYNTKKWRSLSRVVCSLNLSRVSTGRYLSAKSEVGRSAARGNKKVDAIFSRLLGRLAVGNLKSSKVLNLASTAVRIAASNIYVFMALQHTLRHGERPVSELNVNKLGGLDRRICWNFGGFKKRWFLFRALAQASAFGGVRLSKRGGRGAKVDKKKGSKVLGRKPVKDIVFLIRLGGFNVLDLEKGAKFMLKKFSKEGVRAGVYNAQSALIGAARVNAIQHLINAELAVAAKAADSALLPKLSKYVERSSGGVKKVSGVSVSTQVLYTSAAEGMESADASALSSLRSHWQSFCGWETEDVAEKKKKVSAVFPESDRHVTATILNKLNQKYVGRDRIDTDDSMRKIKYADSGFEGKVRPYFFEKFRKDPVHGDRVLQLLVSVLAREGKLVRMQKIFNEVSRRSKFSVGEAAELVFNEALRELRPTYANYLHIRGRSREIMPRPITFHQAVSLSLRFFKRKLISKDSRNAALKSVKNALINEIDNHFAEYKGRNSFFEEYVEQSKQNAFLVAGYKTVRDRLEEDRTRDYQERVGAIVTGSEKSIRRPWISREVSVKKKMYISKYKIIKHKLDLKYSDRRSADAMLKFSHEKARRRGRLIRGDKRKIKKK